MIKSDSLFDYFSIITSESITVNPSPPTSSSSPELKLLTRIYEPPDKNILSQDGWIVLHYLYWIEYTSMNYVNIVKFRYTSKLSMLFAIFLV